MNMECSKKMNVKTPTIERCNEMISGFENQINDMFKTEVYVRYEGEERELLIKTIQDNPTHFWRVTPKGLIHYGI